MACQSAHGNCLETSSTQQSRALLTSTSGGGKHARSASASQAAVAMIRYNQRVLPVLSYVSQFAVPPDSFNVLALAHRSVHSILRIPPNSFCRKLTNTIGFNPLPINSYCASVRYRFAVSEASYLVDLKRDILALI